MRLLLLVCFLTFSRTGDCQVLYWQQIADAPFAERDDAVGVKYNDMYAYAGTGMDNTFSVLNDWWQFSFSTGQWNHKADFPGGPRQYASAFVLNNRVYVATGVGNGIYYNDLWEYHPESDSWQQKASLPEAGRSSCAVFTVGEYAYLCGGFFGLTEHSSAVWRYDYQTDDWQQMADMPVEIRLASGFSVGAFGYVAGGFNEQSGTLNSTYRYNPAADEWIQVGNLPEPRLGAKVVEAPNTVFLFCGGLNFSEFSNNAYFFNTQQEQWYNFELFIGEPRKGAIAFSGLPPVLFIGTGISGAPQFQRFNDMYQLEYPLSVFETERGQVHVFPNPAGDFVQVLVGDDSRPFLLQVVDLNGKTIVFPGQYVSGSLLNVAHLSPGIYVLQLISGEEVKTTKLVKY